MKTRQYRKSRIWEMKEDKYTKGLEKNRLRNSKKRQGMFRWQNLKKLVTSLTHHIRPFRPPAKFLAIQASSNAKR